VILAQMTSHESTDWEQLADRARFLGAKHVVLMGPSPQWRPSLPIVVASRYWGRHFQRVKDGLAPWVAAADPALERRLAHASRLSYLSMVRRLCNDDGCLAVVGDAGPVDLIAVDPGHLSPKGSIFVGERVLHPYLRDIVGISTGDRGISTAGIR